MNCHEVILSGCRWSCEPWKNFHLCERWLLPFTSSFFYFLFLIIDMFNMGMNVFWLETLFFILIFPCQSVLCVRRNSVKTLIDLIKKFLLLFFFFFFNLICLQPKRHRSKRQYFFCGKNTPTRRGKFQILQKFTANNFHGSENTSLPWFFFILQILVNNVPVSTEDNDLILDNDFIKDIHFSKILRREIFPI